MWCDIQFQNDHLINYYTALSIFFCICFIKKFIEFNHQCRNINVYTKCYNNFSWVLLHWIFDYSNCLRIKKTNLRTEDFIFSLAFIIDTTLTWYILCVFAKISKEILQVSCHYESSAFETLLSISNKVNNKNMKYLWIPSIEIGSIFIRVVNILIWVCFCVCRVEK